MPSIGKVQITIIIGGVRLNQNFYVVNDGNVLSKMIIGWDAMEEIWKQVNTVQWHPDHLKIGNQIVFIEKTSLKKETLNNFMLETNNTVADDKGVRNSDYGSSNDTPETLTDINISDASMSSVHSNAEVNNYGMKYEPMIRMYEIEVSDFSINNPLLKGNPEEYMVIKICFRNYNADSIRQRKIQNRIEIFSSTILLK